MNLRFYTLWAINGPLDERRLCDQLDQMKGWGFDGAVFHPRFYPGIPEYLSDAYLAILSNVILYAKSIGMEIWLYDENGWPSGTVGGALLERWPEDRQQWAGLVDEPPAESLGSFEYDGKQWHVARQYGEGVDYFRPQLAQHFLEMTYDRYRLGLDPDAFAHVTTFFSDEPEFGLGHAYDSLSPHGAVPWTTDLPDLYRAKYGEDLSDILPLLFFPGPGYEQARVRFWELLTDTFNDAFAASIDNWCRRHGKRFTAHVKGEEHPLFQVPMVGSAHQFFRRVGLPGIDALERDPSGDFFPRQVASAARQFGNGDCMVECFGGAGWGSTPEDLERYLKWLVGHGLNHFVVHLFQYDLTTHAIHDWPSSTPAHVTWRDAYPQLFARIRKYADGVTRDADTLIIAPYRGIMAEYEPRELLETNVHNASTYPDSPSAALNDAFLALIDRVQKSGVGYHVCDERSVEHSGSAEDGALRVGNCVYRNVILSEGTRFSDETRALLSGLKFEGVNALPLRASTSAASTKPATVSVVPVEWEVQPIAANTLVIDAKMAADGQFIARFDAATALKVEAVFADAVTDVTLNDAPLGDDRTARCRKGANGLRFRCAANEPIPFVSLRGRFAVRSLTPYVAGLNGTVQTDGPFVLEAASKPTNAEDLIAAGYPFCTEPITVRGMFELTRAATGLRLTDVRADAARVRVDGADCGWCWGPDWSFALPEVLDAGRYAIEVKLIPSTFNRYGPHHHIDGDIRIVSPMQYNYVKNFADRPDAPDDTRVAAWHFKPLSIAGGVTDVAGD